MEPFVVLLCAVLTAVDGDTVKCDGENLRIMGNGAPYESGIDAPEIGRRADCPEEDRRGQLAKARISEYLNTRGIVVENSGVKDPYDRYLVALRLPDGTTVGQRLIDEGHAVEWFPGYKDSWCKTGQE